jgi:hypothetical protein
MLIRQLSNEKLYGTYAYALGLEYGRILGDLI